MPDLVVLQRFEEWSPGKGFNDRRDPARIVRRLTRQILIEYTRRRGRSLSQPEEAERVGTAAYLRQVLKHLQGRDPRVHLVAEMHYHYGFTVAEIASTTDSPVSTVERDLQNANIWLERALVEHAGDKAG